MLPLSSVNIVIMATLKSFSVESNIKSLSQAICIVCFFYIPFYFLENTYIYIYKIYYLYLYLFIYIFSTCKMKMQIVASSWWWLEGVLGNSHSLLRLEVPDWGASMVGFWWGSLPVLQRALILLCAHLAFPGVWVCVCVCIGRENVSFLVFLLVRTPALWDQDPTLWPHLSLHCLLIGPMSKYSHIRGWGSNIGI